MTLCVKMAGDAFYCHFNKRSITITNFSVIPVTSATIITEDRPCGGYFHSVFVDILGGVEVVFVIWRDGCIYTSFNTWLEYHLGTWIEQLQMSQTHSYSWMH